MAVLTIRKLDDELKTQLRILAAKHGRSMEEEAREILRKELMPTSTLSGGSLYRQIRSLVEEVGGVELDIPPRSSHRVPPSFD